MVAVKMHPERLDGCLRNAESSERFGKNDDGIAIRWLRFEWPLIRRAGLGSTTWNSRVWEFRSCRFARARFCAYRVPNASGGIRFSPRFEQQQSKNDERNHRQSYVEPDPPGCRSPVVPLGGESVSRGLSLRGVPEICCQTAGAGVSFLVSWRRRFTATRQYGPRLFT